MIKLFTKKRKGFTLIELIVVIAILGILIAIAVPRLTTVREGAAAEADKATARAIASAVSIYEAEKGASPSSIGDLVPDYLNAIPKSAETGQLASISFDADTNQLTVKVGNQTVTP